MRTVVLGIWTNGKRKKKQIFEKLKEKKESLQSVRKISTNVLARRLKEKEKAEMLHEKFTKRQRERNVCAPAMENGVCELYKNRKSTGTMFVHSVEMLLKKGFYANFLLILPA